MQDYVTITKNTDALGIATAALAVMQCVVETDGETTPSYIALRMEVQAARVSGLLNTLEEKGWIERSGVQGDRRKVRVRLTERGREIWRGLD